MKTGSHLRIQQMGTNAMGVRLEGNKSKPEPIYFRIMLPFGDVDIVRCDDGTYWIHARVNKPDDGGDPDRKMGKFIDARIDITDRHTADCNPGDFENPNMDHMAVRIGGTL